MSTRPSALFVSACPPVQKPTLGGNHRYLLGLLDAAVSSGIDAHWIGDEQLHYEALRARIEALGVRRHRAPFCTDASAGAVALDDAIDALHPALIHCNGHSGWLATVARGSRRLASVEHRIYTMHLPPPTLAAQQDHPFGWIEKFPGRWGARGLAQDRGFLRRFSEIVSVSWRYGRLLSERGYVESSRVSIVPNGVDTHLFATRKVSRAVGPVRLGAVGNLHRQKRFDLLLDAFARVPSTDAELHVVGEGPEEAALREQAEGLGLAERVHFRGFLLDMPEFFRDLDVFVMTSEAEAAPYAQIEAMACGLPSLVTAVGDLPFLVRDGVDGLLVSPGDVAAIANGLEKLFGDPQLRAHLGAAARARAESEFSLRVWRERMSEYLRTRVAR